METVRSGLTLPAYLVATGASLLGNAAIAIVLPWLVLERTGDPALAGTVAAISAVPGAAAAFISGYLIDRFGRRPMSVLSDVGSAVSVAGLAIVDAWVGLDIGWFIVLGVLGALFDVPGATAREALLANVSESSGVSMDQVGAARGAVFGVAYLAGPAAAGGLLALLPAIQVVWITAACSGLAALVIAVLPLHAGSPVGTDTGSPLAGFGHVRRSGALLALLMVQLASMFLVTPLLSILLPAHFNRSATPEQLGLALSGYALGTLAGSAVYGWVFRGRRWAAWVTAQLLFVGFAVLIAPLAGFWLIALAMLIAGIGSGILQPVGSVVLATRVPDELRGRVLAVYMTLGMIVAPLGLGLVTVIIAGAGLGASAWALAVGWVLVSGYAIVAPGLRGYIAGDSEEGLDADHQTTG